MPPASVPQGAFTKIDELATDNRVVLRSMEPGETILANKVSGTGGRAILSTLIDPTMRAAAIRVNDVNGVAGFVQPGDRVDVMMTRAASNANRDNADTTLLLQNVKVLGIDQQADDKKDKVTVAKSVTLEVSPDDAQKLTLSSTIGSLSLALRNYATDESIVGRRISIGDLVPTVPKDATPLSPVEAPPAKHTVEVIRGANGGTTYDVGTGSAVSTEKAAGPPMPARPAARRTKVSAQTTAQAGQL
jgi:pilus assembly protein CpaB